MVTVGTVMVAATQAGAMAAREYVRGVGDIVVAKALSHPCGHREDVVLQPSRFASEHEVKGELAAERQRDCANCRWSAGLAGVIARVQDVEVSR